MAGEIFLEFDVKGESTDKLHPGTIECHSCSWGVSNPSTIGTGTTGHGKQRGVPSDISLSFSPSKASPELWMKCVLGEHFKEAKLYFVKSGGATPVDWQVLAMKNAFISSYQQGGSGGDATESISLAFGALEVTYKPQKSDSGSGEGDVVHKYNFEERTS